MITPSKPNCPGKIAGNSVAEIQFSLKRLIRLQVDHEKN